MTIFRGAALAAATVALVGAAYAGAAGPTRFSGESTVGGATVPGVESFGMLTERPKLWRHTT